ncbi:MAG: hypothetical protein J3R72DRAFT_454488 [Linnemannia gamsii]|nr:MAG: hypothetical protein J3R72DRAFT_454488 [Linnemannia gamsii]
MKFNTLFFVATLASCTQAMKLVYIATNLSRQGTDGFQATLWLNDVEMYTSRYRGNSQWMPLGIHKVQLKNPEMGSFEFCLDVFGNVDCEKVWVTSRPKCVQKFAVGELCTTNWVEPNWGP